MPDQHERVDLPDMVCPVCREPGSILLLMNPQYHLRTFETSKGRFFVHLHCIDEVVKEWIEEHQRKQL